MECRIRICSICSVKRRKGKGAERVKYYYKIAISAKMGNWPFFFSKCVQTLSCKQVWKASAKCKYNKKCNESKCSFKIIIQKNLQTIPRDVSTKYIITLARWWIDLMVIFYALLLLWISEVILVPANGLS